MLVRFTRLFAAALLLPAVFSAAPRFSAGARADFACSGFEFRFWMPTKSGASAFIAPQAIGFYSGSSSSSYYYYNIGLRTGIMFRPDNWISPIVDVGVGYSDNDGDNKRLGARAAIGISVAPFQYSSEDAISWLRGLGGLRFEFDSGLLYRRDNRSSRSGTFERSENLIFLPDAGVGFIFSW